MKQRPPFSFFEWDENKRLSNLEKHKIDFIRVAALLQNAIVTSAPERDGEIRCFAFCGGTQDAIVVVFTMRGESCRIISARKAHRSERRRYQALLD